MQSSVDNLGARPASRPRRFSSRVLFAAAAALGVALASAGAVVTAQASVPPTPGGWNLAFADDFNGSAGSLPSGSNWRFDLGHSYPGGPANWGTGEIQNYTNSPNNVSLDGGGNLRMTPLREGAGWTSSRIETHRGDFKAPTGGLLRIEGRIQMPNVTGAQAEGYWPAFWALGSPVRGNLWNWPGVGEFDIMENVNGLNSVWGVLHCGVAPGGPCNEFSGIGGSRACPGVSCQAGFHTYSFEWDRSISPNQLRWYVDGQQFHSVSQAQVPADTWNNMTSHAGYFILLNVAMGGAFPNGAAGKATPTGATVSGRPMLVDYVAVWTRGGGGGQPPPPPPPPSGNARPIIGLANKCVDVRAANPADGTPVQLYDCNGTSAQQWTRVGNTWRVYGKCLDISDNGTANNTRIHLWSCTGGGNQEWQLRGDGTLYNPRSNRCLDVPWADPANGNQLIIWDCHTGVNQRWRIG